MQKHTPAFEKRLKEIEATVIRIELADNPYKAKQHYQDLLEDTWLHYGISAPTLRQYAKQIGAIHNEYADQRDARRTIGIHRKGLLATVCDDYDLKAAP